MYHIGVLGPCSSRIGRPPSSPELVRDSKVLNLQSGRWAPHLTRRYLNACLSSVAILSPHLDEYHFLLKSGWGKDTLKQTDRIAARRTMSSSGGSVTTSRSFQHFFLGSSSCPGERRTPTPPQGAATSS